MDEHFSVLTSEETALTFKGQQLFGEEKLSAWKALDESDIKLSSEKKHNKTGKEMQPVSETTSMRTNISMVSRCWHSVIGLSLESLRPEQRPSLPYSPVLVEANFPLLP